MTKLEQATQDVAEANAHLAACIERLETLIAVAKGDEPRPEPDVVRVQALVRQLAFPNTRPRNVAPGCNLSDVQLDACWLGVTTLVDLAEIAEARVWIEWKNGRRTQVVR